ncbi:MAG: protein kinase [Proteobacteria bacterium]|nr:protein kinase [Pseudomonadota bacterium]
MSVRGEDETVAGTLAGLGPTRTTPTGVDVGADRIANRYQIVRWLGGGGMGRVYEAFDTELGERVALKVLSGGLTEEAHERFRREVRLTRRIQHRNVARMFDIGEHAGEKFLTMELIDGAPLTRLLGAGPLGWGKLRSAALQIAQGLAAAHEVGVIHRDLKPDNVLVELATGRFVITDFGIARSGDDPNVTQIGAVVGTPRYMAPEQLAGRDVDARADLFAYGVMLFELATGTRPWSGDNPIAIAVAQATQPSRPFVVPAEREVPPAFGALVMACLALEPDARPPSATEIARRITDETDPPDTATGRTPKFAITTSGPAFVPPLPTAMRTIATTETSIVVLPVTCAPGDEYLADGMHEDLIDTLSTIPTVRVRPAGLVRGVIEPDVRALGRALEVEHVVSVSLRRTPAGLRVAGRLIGVADGFQIWAHRADCVEAEILAQTDVLARGIAAALSTRAHPATRPTDPRAVDLYLRARAELRHFMAEHVQRAAELLEEAYLLTPTSAPILGARAYAAVQSWVFLADPKLVPIARRAIEQGLEAGHGEVPGVGDLQAQPW